jgi:hypothetical protein
MLAKLALLVQSKVAVAVLGAVLVVGGGSAAALAATGKISLPGATSTHSTSQSQGSDKSDTSKDKSGDSHAHTEGIEGTLVACASAANTICVKDSHGKTFIVVVNSSTEINGDHALVAKGLSKAIGHKVQVQATVESNGSLVAWKVTIEGADGDSSDGTQGNGGDQGQQDTVIGAISALGVGSFAVKLDEGGTKIVSVSNATTFGGRAHQFSDLKVGMHVVVRGTTQSNGNIAATQIEAA